MEKPTLFLISLVLATTLIGCDRAEPENSNADANTATSSTVTEEVLQGTAAETVPTTEPSFERGLSTAVPKEETVAAARDEALIGLSPEQENQLTVHIADANLKLERLYLHSDIFRLLENPNAPAWNYFEQTGQIQIGWSYDGEIDMDTVCEQEGLTEEDFYDKYGEVVLADNDFDANGLIAFLEEFLPNIRNTAFKADVRYIVDEMRMARNTHEMPHANNAYKALHDLDYFLLRYGPVDVGQYVQDTSTVSKYYGMLTMYA